MFIINEVENGALHTKKASDFSKVCRHPVKGYFACAQRISNMNTFPTLVRRHQATASLSNLPNLDPKEQHSLLIYSQSRVGKQQHNNTPHLQRIGQKYERRDTPFMA